MVDALAAYVTSITAQPEFGSAIAALQTAVPLSAIAEIGANPEAYIMDLATGEAPDWYTAIPTSVVDYIGSIGEQALSLVEAGTGISALPGGLIGDAEASVTAAYGAYTAGGYGHPGGGHSYHAGGYSYPTGGYAYPTGGYAYPTGGYPYHTGGHPHHNGGYPHPTGGYSSTSGTPVSSGFTTPTSNASVPSLPGSSTSPSPSVFTGAAASKNVAMGAAAMGAGVAVLFAL